MNGPILSAAAATRWGIMILVLLNVVVVVTGVFFEVTICGDGGRKTRISLLIVVVSAVLKLLSLITSGIAQWVTAISVRARSEHGDLTPDPADLGRRLRQVKKLRI